MLVNVCARERVGETRTASGLPMILAMVEVASERTAEVSTPSRFTLAEMFRHGIVLSSRSQSHSLAVFWKCVGKQTLLFYV